MEAAIAAHRGNVVAVEYKAGDRQTMEENVVRFGLNNVQIVDDMESYSHRWPVPDVAFLVASDKLDLELKTLVHVNPKDPGGDLHPGVQHHEPHPRDAVGKTASSPPRSCSWRSPRWGGRTRLKSSPPLGSSPAKAGRE